MLTDVKLLELIYNATTCYIPNEELNEEQLERFDNITYRWCNCRRCKKPFKIGDKVIIPQNMGHANTKALQIFLSRPFLRQHQALPYSMFLYTLIGVTLHEIVHILFPKFDEKQTIDKTWEWLRKNKWVSVAEEFERTAKTQFER